MAEVDRIMIDELGISLLQMMENAGRLVARYVMDRYRPRTVRVLAGSGGNGGGGLVVARNLSNWGVEVSVTLASNELKPVPQHQATVLENLGVPFGEPGAADVIVDAIIGYSLSGAPRGRAADLIEFTNAAVAPVVALDVPSGVDVDTGSALGAAVRATATVTLAAPKVGLLENPLVGDLVMADISVPPAVFGRLGLLMPADVFSAGPLVAL